MEILVILGAFIAILSAVGKNNQEKAKRERGNPQQVYDMERTNSTQTSNSPSLFGQTSMMGERASTLSNTRTNDTDGQRNAEMVEWGQRSRMEERQNRMDKGRRSASANERKHEKNLNQTRTSKTFGGVEWGEAGRNLSDYSVKVEKQQEYRERSKEEQQVLLQRDRAESKQRRVQDDARKVNDEIENIKRRDTQAQEDHSARSDYAAGMASVKQSPLMVEVKDLIVMGPDDSMPHGRDFISEATEMINSFL